MSPYVYLIGAGVLVLLALVAVLAVMAGERIDVLDWREVEDWEAREWGSETPIHDALDVETLRAELDAPGSGRFGEAS